MNETLIITPKIIESVGGVTKYFTWGAVKMTDMFTWIASRFGIAPTIRWSAMITLFFTILIIYMSLKISKPIIKWILIILGVIIILGMLFPSW